MDETWVDYGLYRKECAEKNWCKKVINFGEKLYASKKNLIENYLPARLKFV